MPPTEKRHVWKGTTISDGIEDRLSTLHPILQIVAWQGHEIRIGEDDH